MRKLVVPRQTILAVQKLALKHTAQQVYPDTIDHNASVRMYYWSQNTHTFVSIPDRDPAQDIEEWAAQWETQS